MARADLDSILEEADLSRVEGSVTSRYVHHLDEVLVAAANRVAEVIFSMMTSPQPETLARKRSSSMLESAEQVSA
ncbi:hypothetical protein ACFOW6_11325 [Fodinicurvata halophila]|uniref:Uncharacterized protein n=1 Tax=Fodinicurvata halophila TaxID=1419723 RepID=A0ABV8ULG9_9PROT